MSVGQWIGIAMLAAFPLVTYRSRSWMGWKTFSILAALLLIAAALVHAVLDLALGSSLP